MSIYSIGKPLVALFYKLYFRVTVEGQENIPDRGSVLFCCNHRSNFDPPLIGISIARDLSFVAKEELFEIPLFGRLLRHLHAFPIRRGTGDRGALRVAVRLLGEGHTLLIFPEGTRNRSSNRLQKGLSGAGFFALKTDAVVIPCAIIGQYKFRGKIKVVFGPPIDTASMKSEKLRSTEASAVIMEHILQLLDQHGK
ncbi:lysophospholipid acyltransferase family protein [Sporolactobacillus putidus]|uniref:1-acyl-sn-glycerol-3-phosphate acyltransferase n=1 Tax=Sporolactobacillus putidus TaxID=492735 RepID=A0A917RZ03_9BACL|nr:lysophospholipid acyltransferase family protein [Sporolactobacillus putidus]GGL47027.1 1-acyl-sn-glycerol-3-phosphate acyltransferase [Sporolactobacillus putidus]